MAGWVATSPLAKVVDFAGFAYDPDQDIIFSKRDALQRQLGYAYAFDALAMAMDADIDCEPVFFTANGKLWMIELWKGQYGLETGCEVGIYNRPANAPPHYALLDALVGGRPTDPDPTHGQFFQCADDSEMLDMSFSLFRGGQLLFKRSQRHWWLTGFKWGVYSLPQDLVMDVSITFQDDAMADAFENALVVMGYTTTRQARRISFQFGAPRSVQPPRDQVVLDAVRAQDQTIVQLYNSLNLPNNDPNTIPDAAVNSIVSAVTGRSAQALGEILATALRDAGTVAEEIGTFLVDQLGLAAEEMSGWLTAAGFAIVDWVRSIYAALQDLFALNFSCAVEIVNDGGGGNPPLLLTRTDFGIVTLPVLNVPCGSWFIPPPPVIKPGETHRFYLKDEVDVAGAEGWAEYAFVDEQGQPGSVRFTFGCPTGFAANYAAANPTAAFAVAARSGSGGRWNGVVPAGGHPLDVRFSWGPPGSVVRFAARSRRIVRIGGTRPDGSIWQLTVPAAIDWIENRGHKFTVATANGPRIIVAGRDGRKYLRSVGDRRDSNNLRSLPKSI